MSEPEKRAPRPPWSEFKAALEAAGFRPSRRLGQNFLLDENAAKAIVRDAQVSSGDFVLEVGPGCGFLSVHLAHEGVKLLSVEIDTRLAPIAAGFLKPYSNAEVIEADALASKRVLAPEILERIPTSGRWHLVANLPYSVGGPILACLAALPHPPDSMTVLVQAEVADRLAAQAGTRAWGPLTVGVQLAYEAEVVRQVAPGLFWPRPKVDSAVVRMVRREGIPEAPVREARRDLAAGLLQRRRQTLRRVLGDWVKDKQRASAALETAGLDGGQRVGDLDLEGLARLQAALGE